MPCNRPVSTIVSMCDGVRSVNRVLPMMCILIGPLIISDLVPLILLLMTLPMMKLLLGSLMLFLCVRTRKDLTSVLTLWTECRTCLIECRVNGDSLLLALSMLVVIPTMATGACSLRSVLWAKPCLCLMKLLSCWVKLCNVLVRMCMLLLVLVGTVLGLSVEALGRPGL